MLYSGVVQPWAWSISTPTFSYKIMRMKEFLDALDICFCLC